jgi:hypothetical protein
VASRPLELGDGMVSAGMVELEWGVSGCCVDVNGASTRRDLELVVDKSVQLYINNETVEGSPFVKTSKTTMSWAS